MTVIIDLRRPQRDRLPVAIWLRAQLFRLTDWARQMQQQRNARRTARQLSNLPFDVRKDIGWPASDEVKRERR